MIRLIFGTVVAAVAMFIAGFLYFAGPLAEAGHGRAGENESAILQQALKDNLAAEGTGTYMIPYPGTQTGTTLYGNGPVATVHFNSSGFALGSADGMLWGFILYLIVAILMAAALSQLDRRVPDFRSRATIVICFVLGMSALNVLGNPIWMHEDWRFAIFTFIGDVFILGMGGLILARWFMPVKAELEQAQTPPAPSTPQKAEEVASSEEVHPPGGAGF